LIFLIDAKLLDLIGGEKKLSNWQEDKKWSDKFINEIKSILGIYLIGEAPAEEDAERNTDLMVLKMDAVRVGCRIRESEYLGRYGNEFTIRSGRPSGIKTELAKIIEGWGDYFFYGFVSDKLIKWTLADLKVFRLWYNTELYKGNKPGILKQNKDGSSNFMCFKWNELPRKFIVGQSVDI